MSLRRIKMVVKRTVMIVSCVSTKYFMHMYIHAVVGVLVGASTRERGRYSMTAACGTLFHVRSTCSSYVFFNCLSFVTFSYSGPASSTRPARGHAIRLSRDSVVIARRHRIRAISHFRLAYRPVDTASRQQHIYYSVFLSLLCKSSVTWVYSLTYIYFNGVFILMSFHSA